MDKTEEDSLGQVTLRQHLTSDPPNSWVSPPCCWWGWGGGGGQPEFCGAHSTPPRLPACGSVRGSAGSGAGATEGGEPRSEARGSFREDGSGGNEKEAKYQMNQDGI